MSVTGRSTLPLAKRSKPTVFRSSVCGDYPGFGRAVPKVWVSDNRSSKYVAVSVCKLDGEKVLP